MEEWYKRGSYTSIQLSQVKAGCSLIPQQPPYIHLSTTDIRNFLVHMVRTVETVSWLHKITSAFSEGHCFRVVMKFNQLTRKKKQQILERQSAVDHIPLEIYCTSKEQELMHSTVCAHSRNSGSAQNSKLKKAQARILLFRLTSQY